MTHNKRDTSDLTKFALISHLDIYRDHSEMHVMPGFVSDNAYGGSATGLKTYKVKAFAQGPGNYLLALGTKSDGTGSKVFQKNVGTDSEWSNATTFGLHDEGSADLVEHPFLNYGINSAVHFPVKKSTTHTDVAQVRSGTYSVLKDEWIFSQPSGASGYLYNVKGFTGAVYLTKAGSNTGISQLIVGDVTTNVKTTALFPYAIASGDYQIALVGSLGTPQEAKVLLWDSASLLADQNITMGNETCYIAGFPNNTFCSVSYPSFRTLEINGKVFMKVRAITGESTPVLYELTGPTTTNLALHDINAYYGNSMLWYTRLSQNSAGTEFVEGVWALGRGSINSQFGVSILLDTSSLGRVERVFQTGYSTYLAHGTDGSVSRLDNFETGTYNVPATIETLIYGADTPYLKGLKGVSIVTENLPTGGSVVAYYRTDEDSAWVTMGTSDTVGKQKHNFTKANGTPIGKFQEIQFKFVITGKTAVKNILVAIEETSDLPF
jgi:hypothetical protein